jgi:hypothetical protein
MPYLLHCEVHRYEALMIWKFIESYGGGDILQKALHRCPARGTSQISTYSRLEEAELCSKESALSK